MVRIEIVPTLQIYVLFTVWMETSNLNWVWFKLGKGYWVLCLLYYK